MGCNFYCCTNKKEPKDDANSAFNVVLTFLERKTQHCSLRLLALKINEMPQCGMPKSGYNKTTETIKITMEKLPKSSFQNV